MGKSGVVRSALPGEGKLLSRRCELLAPPLLDKAGQQ